jgi:hypothetical protein
MKKLLACLMVDAKMLQNDEMAVELVTEPTARMNTILEVITIWCTILTKHMTATIRVALFSANDHEVTDEMLSFFFVLCNGGPRVVSGA